MIPLSLIPKRVLVDILQSFVTRSQFTASRLILSIPIANIMSYYETKHVLNVISTDFGLMFTVSIPFSSGETILDVFHAIPLPMLTTDSIRATMWDLETEYKAVTENQNEAALLTAYDIEECIGSESYSICFSSFPMEKSKDSCLVTLLFKDSLSALEVCRIRNVQLPPKAWSVVDHKCLGRLHHVNNCLIQHIHLTRSTEVVAKSALSSLVVVKNWRVPTFICALTGQHVRILSQQF